jgi:uncharacterized protein (TIGR02444 family)
MSKTSKASDRLWAFANAVYAAPDVAAACLRLQDRDGLSVNMALFCCWSGPLTAEAMQQAIGETAAWAQVLDPLRAARRAAKARDDSLYAQLKDAELAAERRHLAALAPIGVEGAAANANFDVYRTALGRAEEAEMMADWAIVAAAARAGLVDRSGDA